MEQAPPQNCPMCQSFIKEKSGISKKTGKPYRFYGCSNYPKCDYVWHPEPESKEETKETKVIPILELCDKDLEKILTPFRELWKKIDDLEKKIEGMKRVEIVYPNGDKEEYLEKK